VERIRVMHIIARMNVGGPAVEIAELMRGLDPSSFDQRLVTGWCADDEADFLLTQAPDVPVVRLDGLGRSIRPTDDVRALQRLVAAIRAFRPHIVHTHTAKAGVLGRAAARASGTGARIVHTHHGHLLHGYFSPARTRAVVLVEQGLSRVSDRLVTVGDQVREDLLAAGIGRAEQYTVIHSGVCLGPLPTRADARRELGVADDAAVVSVIGRLTRIKRPDRVAAVSATVQAQVPEVRFLVAGGGDEEDSLRDAVSRRDLPITLLGWRTDLERILAATDLVLLTSDNEGTPLSLVQAGLARVPAVATDVGSVSEVVEHGVTGVLCPPDPSALAAAVVDLLSNQGRRVALGTAARQRAQSLFSVSAFLDAHSALYGAVASRGPAIASRR
jgi:glycosyltransferase involved in cell wall biosynthesis